ncbi:MAG: HepT-like ribonuclease domain-containing protein [Candidatus Helarchaeota archaeon]
MKKDNTVFLKHVLDAISLIEDYLKGKNFQEFRSNHMLQDAVIREIEIIGEATKNYSADFINKYSDIPWKQIAGMRDKLIHGYFGVDLDAVWDTATKDIPSLKERLLKILKEEENT